MKDEELRAARRRRGLTQAELASLAGVSPTTIKNIETGRHGYRQQRVTDGIADALDRFDRAEQSAPLAPPPDNLARIAAALERIAASLERSEVPRA